jgi:hypothetical protein
MFWQQKLESEVDQSFNLDLGTIDGMKDQAGKKLFTAVIFAVP